MILGQKLDKLISKLNCEATGGVGGGVGGGSGGSGGNAGSSDGGGGYGGYNGLGIGNPGSYGGVGDSYGAYGGSSTGYGGFGGLGIGNPGSYGGASSVGAVGGTGGADLGGFGDLSGWAGYSAEAMNVAMSQSDAQAAENEAIGFSGNAVSDALNFGFTYDVFPNLDVELDLPSTPVNKSDLMQAAFGVKAAFIDSDESLNTIEKISAKKDAAFEMYSSQTPKALSYAWNAIAPTFASMGTVQKAAAYGAALSGNLTGTSSEVGNYGGSGSGYGAPSDVLKGLAETAIGGSDVADNTTDLMAQLQAELGGLSGDGSDNISFKVGNQEVSIMPKAKREELALLLDYLKIQQSGDQYQQSASWAAQQAEPSTIDKSSQLIGLGSDAIGLWQGISSMW